AYVHPWEVDPGQPRLAPGRLKAFRHYINLHRTERRLSRHRQDFFPGTRCQALSRVHDPRHFSTHRRSPAGHTPPPHHIRPGPRPVARHAATFPHPARLPPPGPRAGRPPRPPPRPRGLRGRGVALPADLGQTDPHFDPHPPAGPPTPHCLPVPPQRRRGRGTA